MLLAGNIRLPIFKKSRNRLSEKAVRGIIIMQLFSSLAVTPVGTNNPTPKTEELTTKSDSPSNGNFQYYPKGKLFPFERFFL